ncbi:hypothetical protein BaRGS_00007669 [Batillaria attramentaria]|uniref:SSD domain-containing protein n=1 Tax=Batillaria attramentaria TaxID=370345 RepID=A0ABD0LNH6_9CAEN
MTASTGRIVAHQLVRTWKTDGSVDDAFGYEDVCGRLDGECQVWGSLMLSDEFWDAYQAGNAHFPFWESSWGPADLSLWLGGTNLSENETVHSATSMKITFTLRQDSEDYKKRALEWEHVYIANMQELGDDYFTTLDYAYSSSQSMGDELDRGTKGDIIYFSLTFTLMITYASIVSSGGDCVSTRALLANAGVLAAGMGIMAAFGLLSFVGVHFVNICGVVPFLVLGIGVDDMFLLMSSWSSTMGTRDLSVPRRIGATFRAAGIGITITSITDFLAFAIGASSVFLSVRNFCLYSGVAVLFCYLCNATFFGGCLAVHGRRVYSGRHTITCRKIRARKDMSEEGEKCCKICMCGGATPDSEFADESPFEKGPRILLPRLVLWNPAKAVIVLLFCGYLAASIWGVVYKLEQGLRLKDLVLRSSYYHKFNTWDETDFGVAFPVAFVIPEPKVYTNASTMMNMIELMTEARKDPDISITGSYCWFDDYFFSPYINLTDEAAFARALREDFLPRNTRYVMDVVFDENNETIVASRCHVFSKVVTESTRQAELMIRMRELADSAPFHTFAYQPAFVYFEQYVMIMSSTLQTVGITLAVMFVITFIFLVHPIIVLLVFFNIVMILVGIFGFMGIWGLTLSSVTMIHLIMSVGFSVDFSAHVCSAYMLSEARTRRGRTEYALVHASGPILNSGLSSLLGIVVLIFSDSFIFQSFFKIMLLVISFGILHAVFLIPVLLSWLGPLPSDDGSLSALSGKKHSNGNLGNGNVAALGYKKRHSRSFVDGEANGHSNGKAHTNGSSSPISDALGYMSAYENKAFTDL